jgi:hypothetical protein
MGIPIVSGIASSVGSMIGANRTAAAQQTLAASSATVGPKPKPGVGAAIQRLLPGGATGMYAGRRHMNVGNAKAARRAIRRITGVRKMLMSIERQMPHRACNRQHAKSGRR